VGHADEHFVDYLVGAYGAREEGCFQRRRVLGDEVVLVEAEEVLFARATSEGGDVEDGGVGGHGAESGGGVFVDKFFWAVVSGWLFQGLESGKINQCLESQARRRDGKYKSE